MREHHKSISIADQIFEQLERDILTGKYPRGEILTEHRLSNELGVSRTPVREAIRRLEQENLLEEHGRGIVVVGISFEDMLDMYEIRLQLEAGCAKRSAENISDEMLRELEDIIELQQFYIQRQNPDSSEYSDKIKNLDSRFHELLYISSGSKAYSSTLIPIHKKMTKFRKASVSKHSRAMNSIEEHIAILDALKRHDGEAAAKLLVQHSQNALDRIRETEGK